MTQDPDMANPEVLAKTLEQHPDYRILRRFKPESLMLVDGIPEDCPDVGIAVLLDTETTGKDRFADRIIELGMVSFAYSRTSGAVLGALATFSALEDPGMPISPEATAINGITDEMVRGKRIDDAAVRDMVEMADFVLAHNASFDRVLCEARWPLFQDLPWACSVSQVDWAAAGIGSAKLDYIAYRLGFFYDAHRAEGDCLALLNALNQPLPEKGGTAFADILGNYRKEERRIWAVGAPFDAKDVLKARGYYWSPGDRPGTEKAWWTVVSEEKFDEELAWLRENVYRGPFSVPVDRIDALNRFSERRTAMPRAYVKT